MLFYNKKENKNSVLNYLESKIDKYKIQKK